MFIFLKSYSNFNIINCRFVSCSSFIGADSYFTMKFLRNVYIYWVTRRVGKIWNSYVSDEEFQYYIIKKLKIFSDAINVPIFYNTFLNYNEIVCLSIVSFLEFFIFFSIAFCKDVSVASFFINNFLNM